MRIALILISTVTITFIAGAIYFPLGVVVGMLALGGASGLIEHPAPKKLTPNQQANADRRFCGYEAPPDEPTFSPAERKINALRKKLGYE